jgi:hypothetical protein
MWLHMGMDTETFGFWDRYESYDIYREDANYNKEKSSELFIAAIKERLSNATFSQMLNMYYKKLVWTWTEGTYQIQRYGFGSEGSTNSNMMTKNNSNVGNANSRGNNNRSFRNDNNNRGGNDSNQGTIQSGWQRGGINARYSYNTFATNMFKGDSIYITGMLWVIYLMNFLMFCFIITRLILQIKDGKYNELFLILIILGFIAFYLVWEIKARYIYPVYPLLIVLSYMGYKDLYDIANLKIISRK